jgi:hypothetical protein
MGKNNKTMYYLLGNESAVVTLTIYRLSYPAAGVRAIPVILGRIAALGFPVALKFNISIRGSIGPSQY